MVVRAPRALTTVIGVLKMMMEETIIVILFAVFEILSANGVISSKDMYAT